MPWREVDLYLTATLTAAVGGVVGWLTGRRRNAAAARRDEADAAESLATTVALLSGQMQDLIIGRQDLMMRLSATEARASAAEGRAAAAEARVSLSERLINDLQTQLAALTAEVHTPAPAASPIVEATR